MRQIIDKIKKLLRYPEQQYDNKNLPVEQRANSYTLYALNYVIAAAVLVWLLNILDIFIVEQRLMFTATVLVLIFVLAPKLICHFAGQSEPWIKYMILSCICTAIAIYGVALSYHVVLLFSLPLFFAAQYQNRRLMTFTYCIVIVALFTSVVLSFWLGLCDMNMLLLSAFPTSHYASFETGELFNLSINPSPWITIPLYFFVPRAIILFIFIPVLMHIVDLSAENAVMTAELRRLSEVDRATRFYNKNKYEQMIRGFYPNVDRVGVIFWDLNNLKYVNDNFGHTQGDIIISVLASCISECIENMRHAYRVGGDEFVMIIENPEPDEVEETVSKVQKLLEQRNASSRIPISAAVGYAEGEGSNIFKLIEQADKRMYDSKHPNGMITVSEVPDEYKNSILSDRLFEGIASVMDNVYIFLCDLRTNVSRWSVNAVEYFDMPGEFMSNVDAIWPLRVHPEDRKAYIEDISRIMNGTGIYHKCEYRALNRYGEYVWLECRGNVVYDEVRQTKYFSGIMLRLDNRNKYDPLTKLKTIYELNNVSFDARSGSLLLIGLDDFRKIVNNFGYAFGDIVLAEFAQRLILYCGKQHIPYRMEGDEFLILSPSADSKATQKLFNDIRALGYNIGKAGGRLVNVHFSGGAVLFPKNGTNREELIGNLEHCLERAKTQQRGELVFFFEDIALVHQQAQIINEQISAAIRNNFSGFTMYYQPLVSSTDHSIASCEALLRFKDFDRLGIGISEVISYLERRGDIAQVGRWIADQVFHRAQEWQSTYPALTVGFNVSAVQFQDNAFVDYLIDSARRLNIDPSRITIEITESSEVEDYFSTAQYLSRLREFGFKIALDDFGIAYSTLMLIKTLPTDYVKIDHSFVLHLHHDTNNKDLVIVEAVIELCRKLNIQVVAEGVENAEILEILEQYPIALYQGYYFSRPLPVDDFEALLEVEKNKRKLPQ